MLLVTGDLCSSCKAILAEHGVNEVHSRKPPRPLPLGGPREAVVLPLDEVSAAAARVDDGGVK